MRCPRRIITGSFCRQLSALLKKSLEPFAPYGLSVEVRVELVAGQVAMNHHMGGHCLELGRCERVQCGKRSRMLLVLAENVPPIARYACDLQARTPPKLRFSVEHGQVQVVHSHTGIQQGFNLGPSCHSATRITLLKERGRNPPLLGAKVATHVDDDIILIPTGRAQCMKTLADVLRWHQHHQRPESIPLHRETP